MSLKKSAPPKAGNNTIDIWKMGYGPFAIEMYYLFMSDYGLNRLERLDDDNLDKLYKYSNDKKLSVKILTEMRDRIFRNKSNESIIVNEINGIIELLKGCKRYAKITMRMLKELNDK